MASFWQVQFSYCFADKHGVSVEQMIGSLALLVTASMNISNYYESLMYSWAKNGE